MHACTDKIVHCVNPLQPVFMVYSKHDNGFKSESHAGNITNFFLFCVFEKSHSISSTQGIDKYGRFSSMTGLFLL